MTLYPTPPGKQIQYDRDGSAGFGSGAASSTDLIQLNDQIDNNVSSGNFGGLAATQGIIFPDLMDIVAFGFRQPMSNGNAITVQTSTDTTNGTDGTWTTRGSAISGQTFSASAPLFRITFQGPGGITNAALPFNGIKGIRFVRSGGNDNGNATPSSLHLYGDYSSGSVVDRLRLWHPTLDQELSGSYFDFGDTLRTTVATKPFRVKNNSVTLTANTITLNLDSLTDTSPTVLSQLSIDFNGSGYASSQVIGSLAPGAISAVCTLKTVLLSTATIGTWRQRIKAIATNWS